MQVATWIARGPIPLQVESTANIVEIILRDHASEDPFRAWSKSSPFRSETELRLMYSMAIIRYASLN